MRNHNLLILLRFIFIKLFSKYCLIIKQIFCKTISSTYFQYFQLISQYNLLGYPTLIMFLNATDISQTAYFQYLTLISIGQPHEYQPLSQIAFWTCIFWLLLLPKMRPSPTLDDVVRANSIGYLQHASSWQCRDSLWDWDRAYFLLKYQINLFQVVIKLDKKYFRFSKVRLTCITQIANKNLWNIIDDCQ